MSHEILPPLWIRPQASRRLRFFLLGSHGLAVVALLLSPLPPGVIWLSLGLLALSLAWQWRRVIQMKGWGSCRQCYWDSDLQWHLQDGQSRWFRPLRYRVVWNHPAVILVQFARAGRGPGSVVLLADQLPAELHRQLRVRLVLHPATQLDEGGT